MYSSYSYQIIARQRMDEAARNARTASQRRQLKTRARLALPQGPLPQPAPQSPRPAPRDPPETR